MKPFVHLLSLLSPPTLALLLGACAATGPTSFDATSQGTMVANTRGSNGGGTNASIESAGEPEGIVRWHGQLYNVKNRGLTAIHGKQRVTNGLYLEKNGDVTLADGRRLRIAEGFMVTTGGEVIEAPLYLR